MTPAFATAQTHPALNVAAVAAFAITITTAPQKAAEY
jgi:hypothetical protein